MSNIGVINIFANFREILDRMRTEQDQAIFKVDCLYFLGQKKFNFPSQPILQHFSFSSPFFSLFKIDILSILCVGSGGRGILLGLHPYLLIICYSFSLHFIPVFRIRIRMDPHKDMPLGSGSGSAWTDSDPDPGGKKALKMFRFIR